MATNFTQKFQAGESYGDARQDSANFFNDPAKIAADILKDYVSVRGQTSPAELVGLIKELLSKGEPLDDKKGTTEILIGILTSLPATSKARTMLTNKLIDTLWGNLQHPPLSYVGGDIKYDALNEEGVVLDSNGQPQTKEPQATDSIEFTAPGTNIRLREQVPQAPDGLHHYRSPDGSFNNILEPNLGKAGTPYAKSVRTSKRLHGVKPDPGLLFDLLMARDEGSFKENPAGISSMLFYHASIIIHDIFRTNRTDMNKSDTSSYLDLAPLYGSSLKDQLEIRTMKEGKLKPDTFHEKRLLGQPAGVNVMLVMYSRFHNYVADILLKINENGRFTLQTKPNATDIEKAKAVAKQDHDLFNVARLIVGGLYINISLHDYLRAITNTHHSKSDWTLDPRVEINKQFDSDGVPRGVGNQVSVEFNLLYRFHSCISKKDEKWIDGFFGKIFKGKQPADLQNISIKELGEAFVDYEESIPKDPSVRTFDDLKRQEDGTFKDEDLARILKEAMNDPAGCFGARMVPKALKIIEVLGINQARRWQVASLNEFREFFGLKKYDKFTDINSNPDIASLLEKLYTDPDMVELYPGLMIEDIKPVRNTGSGICPTYSVGRAVLSDAVTLVRSDRFNTIDYTVSNLTAWGFNEVQQDYKTLGGSMLYKLIQRGLPNWFPYNSVAVMQPMYTKKMNETIAKEIGTFHLYTLEDPTPPRKAIITQTSGAIKYVLSNPKQFVLPWLRPLQAMFTDSKRDISWFMLAGDEQKNYQHRINIKKALSKIPTLHNAIHEFIDRVGAELVKKETFKMKEGLHQMDIIRDVAIPLNAQLLADLFYFDLRTDENPGGTLGHAELYNHLLNVRIWGVNDNDPAQSWNRRRRAIESVNVIIESTAGPVKEVHAGRGLGFGIANAISSAVGRRANFKKDSLRSCGYKFVEELLAQGNSVDQVVDNMWLTAFGGIGVPVTTFYEVLSFFLRPENASIWAEVQNLAQNKDDAGLHAYVREAQRLTSGQRNVRVATAPAEIDGKPVQPGTAVVMLLGGAGRNPGEIANPDKFDANRKAEEVSAFSYGQHECLAKDIATTFVVGLVKLAADLKQLRPAPGQMGIVKTIQVGSEKAYLNDSWSYLGFDASTWKVHFDGHGKGTYKADASAPNNQIDLGQYYYLLKQRKENLLSGLGGPASIRAQ
ncbi:linoleate diol synthase [Colletotrichum scovillei]|uniref:linoleate 8R-lipoxygenase n=1 Tax=Colletotrichum scovillei TaxID=1209932 RepID=A0A9P7QRP7_9PEZI|nr:linoleate diol synthase [Colletotrichum scovillei]KAF4774550.1 linoleate diol synthase [Colletotrichum scovillei]KAG7039587.1 linoleate diol synthase [Colletotrichum scovillei]KAG7041765.1 linoleate diol synthase [Colletotrichum scovillei]KAG7061794.1 linoleate diol synthase [Colletotrichum scovillei]